MDGRVGDGEVCEIRNTLELGPRFFSMYVMRTGCRDKGGFNHGSCQSWGSKGFYSGFSEGLGRG